jgi:uncharacterized RDD family membrane protein YckC
MDRRQDPRTIVTPYAFSVHPDLLGVPLATPWQRLGAIAIDGVVIIGLSRIGGLTLAVASSLLLFWLAFRGPGQNVIGKLFRVAAGCMGLMVAFVSAAVFFFMPVAEEILSDPETQAAVQERFDESGVNVNLNADLGRGDVDLSSFITAMPGIFALQSVEDPEEAGELMVQLANAGRAAGLSLREIREALEGMAPDDAPWSNDSQSLVDEAMASLRVGLSEEVSTGEGESTTSSITDPVALDSIESLKGLVQDLDEERRDVEKELSRAEDQLKAAEDLGLLARLRGFLDEIGLGFGWAALYLTITHALWKGTSVGKKMFRIRVVMIDLRPLTWWLSFERVGGYAAGLATGLLGFAQIFWDPNRQAIHDKVSETIVIQVGKEALQGPWVAKGKAQWEESRAHVSEPPLPPDG